MTIFSGFDHELVSDEGAANAFPSCRRCGGVYLPGSVQTLPLYCPGEPMTAEQADSVASDRLNFIRGQWWIPLPHPPEGL
jgi:hypothetical protein